MRLCRGPASTPWTHTTVCLCYIPCYLDRLGLTVCTALAGTSIGFDLLIIALPIPVLMNLQLHRRQKIALVVIFALGFFVTIIQIIRIFTVKNLKTYTDSKPIIMWSVVEISIAVRFPSPILQRLHIPDWLVYVYISQREREC